MPTLQEISSIATLLLCAITVLLAWRVSRTVRDHLPRQAPFFGGGAVPSLDLPTSLPTRREMLPLSTVSGRGYAPDIYVFDTDKNEFRRVGLVDAHGKVLEPSRGEDGINLVKGRLYRLIARPQTNAFRPERIVIGSGTTPGGADDWDVHDITVGHRSQFVQSGVVPGGLFKPDAVDTFIHFDTVQTCMDFGIEVSYRGPNESAPFPGAAIGTAVG